MEVNFFEPLLDIERRAGLTNPWEISMAEDLGLRIIEAEALKKSYLRFLLGGVRVLALWLGKFMGPEGVVASVGLLNFLGSVSAYIQVNKILNQSAKGIWLK